MLRAIDEEVRHLAGMAFVTLGLWLTDVAELLIHAGAWLADVELEEE